MAFYINEQLYFDFYLNGYQIPLTLTDINSLVICSNCEDILPAVRVDINDNKGIFSKGALTDGTILGIAVGTNQENASKNLMEFVMTGSPEQSVSKSRNQYLIYGMLNKPNIRDCIPVGIHGTSNQVLEKIASLLGLNFNGQVTSDEMTWLNGTRNLGEFIKFIEAYGYTDDLSCMKTAIDLSGTLIYKNIMNVQNKWTLTDQSGDEKSSEAIKFDEISFKNNSGTNNFSYGYQSRVLNFDLSGQIDRIADIDFSKNTNVINVNKNTYQQAGLVRNNIMPTNIGNFHPNWAKAYYQNLRFKALNSIQASVYISKKTDLNILDGVTLSIADPISLDIDTSKASKWIVDAKTIAISGQQYIEKYVLSTTGMELDLFNNLK